MDLVGLAVSVSGVTGVVIQYFDDVGRLLVKTGQGAHLLVLPSECHRTEAQIDTPPGGSLTRPVTRSSSPRQRLPDFSWYREGFVRTGAASESAAQAVLSWAGSARSTAERTGLFSVSVVGGDNLDTLLPPPATPVAWVVARSVAPAKVEHHISVRVSLASHPAVAKGGSDSPAKKSSGKAEALHVSTFVNPLTCRRELLFESGEAMSGSRCNFGFPQLCVGIIQPPGPSAPPSPPGRGASRRSEPVLPPFVDPAVITLASQTPLMDWSCLESYLLFQVVASSASLRSSPPSPRPAPARVIGHAIMRVCDVLAGAVREYAAHKSSLHSSIHAVAAELMGGDDDSRAVHRDEAGLRATPAPPFEFFVQLRMPIIPLLHSAVSKHLGDEAPAAVVDVGISLVLPAGLSTLPAEFLEATLVASPRPPPEEATAAAATPACEPEARPVIQRPLSSWGGEKPASVSHARPTSAASRRGEVLSSAVPAPRVAAVRAADLASPTTPARHEGSVKASPSQRRSGGGFRLGARWSLGPGKEAQEERLARTLAAYSNVRVLRPVSAHGAARPSIAASAVPPHLFASDSPSYSHDDVVASEAVTRTVALIRSSVTDLRHSIQDIEEQLQARQLQQDASSGDDNAPATSAGPTPAAAASPAAGSSPSFWQHGKGARGGGDVAEQPLRTTAGLQQQAIRLQDELSHVLSALQEQQQRRQPPSPVVHLVPRPRSAASRRSGSSSPAKRRPTSASGANRW
jgi:hypothetical protein